MTGFPTRETDEAGAVRYRDLADVPALEVISRAVVMLMSAAAEKLGLAAADPDHSAHRDLDEARRLITALAGLIDGAAQYPGRMQVRCATVFAVCSGPSGRPARCPTSPGPDRARSTPARSGRTGGG